MGSPPRPSRPRVILAMVASRTARRPTTNFTHAAPNRSAPLDGLSHWFHWFIGSLSPILPRALTRPSLALRPFSSATSHFRTVNYRNHLADGHSILDRANQVIQTSPEIKNDGDGLAFLLHGLHCMGLSLIYDLQHSITSRPPRVSPFHWLSLSHRHLRRQRISAANGLLLANTTEGISDGRRKKGRRRE